MGQTTNIQWCDSTLNLQMGCDGCELWAPRAGRKVCYAGVMTEKYAGRKGFPEAFDKPALFLNRLSDGERWPDMTGKDREDKPWLSGRPRMIFLNDMGDTFTESLPLDWLAPVLDRIAKTPHVWLLLTKRPRRMAEFSKLYPLPGNIWPGTSVTTNGTAQTRVCWLDQVIGGGPRWLSVEPVLGLVDPGRLIPDPTRRNVSWIIVGGESGQGGRRPKQTWDAGNALDILEACQDCGISFFLKQLGTAPTVTQNGLPVRLKLEDWHGGDWTEWPPRFQVRQVPDLRRLKG